MSKEIRRWRRVVCDECGAVGLELMTRTEAHAYEDDEWIWLCADCYCDGDRGEE